MYSFNELIIQKIIITEKNSFSSVQKSMFNQMIQRDFLKITESSPEWRFLLWNGQRTFDGYPIYIVESLINFE